MARVGVGAWRVGWGGRQAPPKQHSSQMLMQQRGGTGEPSGNGKEGEKLM